MRKMSLGVLAMALVGGCAPQMVWFQEGKTPEQVQRDFAEVRYDVAKHGSVNTGNGISDGMNEAIREREIMNAGMQAKGYRLIPRREAESTGLNVSR